MHDFQKCVQRAKELCKPDDRIKLIEMGSDEEDPIEPGTEGTVQCIDGAGTIHIKWDINRGLGLIPDVDRFEVLDD